MRLWISGRDKYCLFLDAKSVEGEFTTLRCAIYVSALFFFNKDHLSKIETGS